MSIVEDLKRFLYVGISLNLAESANSGATVSKAASTTACNHSKILSHVNAQCRALFSAGDAKLRLDELLHVLREFAVRADPNSRGSLDSVAVLFAALSKHARDESASHKGTPGVTASFKRRL